MSTSNAKQVTTRTLTAEEVSKVTAAFTALNSVLGNYVVGEEPLSPTFNMTSAKHATLVAERALHALTAYRDSERKARLAKIGPIVEKAIAPLVEAQRAIRDSFKDLPPAALAVLKEKGVFSDEASIPLEVVFSSFPSGTTTEYIKDMVTTLGYTIKSTRGPKPSLAIVVSLTTAKPLLNVDQQKAANAANGAATNA